MQAPIRYSPALEQPEEGEAETVAGLEATLTEILETTSRAYGHAVRAVHAKSHGLIEAEFIVLDGLPSDYAQGLFATPGAHPAILRISTNPGDILDDAVSVPRGLALKVLGVEGSRLPGDETHSQDFVLVDGPAFVAPSAAAFLRSLKLLARTTNRAEWAKKALSTTLRGVERALEVFGGESATVKSIGGAPNLHPLGETYHSQTAFRFGAHVAKFSVTPVSETLTRHSGETVAIAGRPDALREEVGAGLQAGPAEWELRVQLCRDLETMPIEDPSVVWPEDQSPHAAVARLVAPPQPGWSEARARVVDEAMRFSVWNGLEAHRPLGAVNRVRRPAYNLSAAFRARFNGCPFHEPGEARLPG